MTMEQVIWRPERTSEDLDRLMAVAARSGGRQAIASIDGVEAAHVHGERHDLWWEFTLEASFKWQAHLHRMRPDRYHREMRRLTRALRLDGLLQREVATLTHESRALADLAVALLPQPEVLIWEEPFYYMSCEAARRAAALVRALHREGLGVLAIAHVPPGLQDLGATAPAPLHIAR